MAAYQKRYKAGIANAYPGYYQLQSNLDNTKALIPQLEISLRQANNQLCVLLGQPVHDLLPELGDGTVPDPAIQEAHGPHSPAQGRTVVLGIPGEFLLRRPDVQGVGRPVEDSVRPDRHRRGGDVPAHRHQRQHRPGVEPVQDLVRGQVV